MYIIKKYINGFICLFFVPTGNHTDVRIVLSIWERRSISLCNIACYSFFNFQAEEIKKNVLCHYAAIMAENLIEFKSRQSYDSLRNCNLVQNTELFWNYCYYAPLQKILS